MNSTPFHSNLEFGYHHLSQMLQETETVKSPNGNEKIRIIQNLLFVVWDQLRHQTE